MGQKLLKLNKINVSAKAFNLNQSLSLLQRLTFHKNNNIHKVNDDVVYQRDRAAFDMLDRLQLSTFEESSVFV